MISRRSLGRLGLGLLAAGLPRRLRAEAESRRHQKFLFIYVNGGWDPTFVFAPLFGNSGIDMEQGSTAAEAGGIAFVDAGSRPSVRSFFERYASRTCIINGMEIRSVTHERCRELMLTGSIQTAPDDFPSRLATSVTGYSLPYFVVSGPAYTSSYSSALVRAGDIGQLSGLLDGSTLLEADPPLLVPDSTVEAAVDAFIQSRVSSFNMGVKGLGGRFGDGYRDALERTLLLKSLQGELELDVVTGYISAAEKARPALACMEAGLSRVAMLDHKGSFDVGWDTHSNLDVQSGNFELLFADLNRLLEEAALRMGTGGGSLLDELTIVVVSEMGRAPKINYSGGKDHWTFTSAMLIGAGVKGGQVVGGFDESFLGRPMDLASGEVSDSGELITSAHLGATLLAMADMDPAEATDVSPITAVIAT